MVIGVMRVEIHVPTAQTLKDKRSVVKRLREQMRGQFNVAVAEVEPNETWQRATLGVSAIGDERHVVEGVLRGAERWLRMTHLVDVIRLEAEYV